MDTVDIVVPIHESLSLVRDCVRAIRAFTPESRRVVLVDDSGSLATHERLAALVGDDPAFELVRNEERLGPVEACARAIGRSAATYVVVMNPDSVVSPGWLERMLACAESDPTIAAVNPLTNEAGDASVRLAPGLGLLSTPIRLAEVSERRYPTAATLGACVLLKRDAIEAAGGFGDRLAERLLGAGLRVAVADDAFVYRSGRIACPWMGDDAGGGLQYVRDRLTRGLMRYDDAHPERLGAVERGMSRLATSEALAAGGEGERASIAAHLLLDRAARRDGARHLDWAADRVERPTLGPGERTPLVPTRGYVARLPKPDPGRLRITFLAEGLPLVGGVISIGQLVRELTLLGHDVTIATERLESEPERHNLWTQPLIYRDRRHLVDELPESDVVVATFWVTAHRYLRDLRRRFRFASVNFVQDYEAWFYPEQQFEVRQQVVATYAMADHTIVKSRWLADMVERHGAPCDIVHLGLDLGIFYPRGGKNPERLRVLSAATPGTEMRRRGFPETVEAFRIVHEARPDVEIVFYGLEPERMPEVPFHYTNAGRLYDQSRVAELMSSVDVLLDASLWQAFGRPGLEAMACGTVPVLTRVGGLTEYARDGENCLLVEPGDPEAAASAILRLLDDAPLRERLASAGPQMATGFSHESEARLHADLYARWAKEARR